MMCKLPKITERKEFIDPETGEKVDQYVFKIEGRNANFHQKVLLWHLASELNLLSNQKLNHRRLKSAGS